MHTLLRRSRGLAALAAAVVGLAHCSLARAQSSDETPPPDVREHRGLVILRISDELLDRLLATDVDTETRVDRCVLGTRAIGSASTEGHADVDPKPDPLDASFRVTVQGVSNSRTVGRNGPAVIHSYTSTEWQVDKVIRFDDGKFVAEPGVVAASRTRMTPLGVGASVPGLRGMLVRRIAGRRVQESRAAAERISGEHTRGRVLGEVDAAIDERIAQLNSQIASRPVLDSLLPLLDTGAARLYTSDDCIHLAFLGIEAVTAVACPLDQLDPRESELWIHSSLLGVPALALPGPSIDALQWLGEQLTRLGLAPLPLPEVNLPDVDVPGVDLPGADLLPSMNIEMVDGWIVLRSPLAEPDEDKPAPKVANEQPAARP